MRKLKCIFSMLMIVTVMAVACGSKAHEQEPKTADPAEGQKKSDKVEKLIKEIEKEEAKEFDGVKRLGDDLTEEDIKDLKDTIRDTVISDYLTPNNIPQESFQWPTEECAWDYLRLLTDVELGKFTPEEDDDIDISEVINIPSDQMYLKDLMEVAFKGVMNWLDKQGEYEIDYYYVTVIGGISPLKEFFSSIEF